MTSASTTPTKLRQLAGIYGVVIAIVTGMTLGAPAVGLPGLGMLFLYFGCAVGFGNALLWLTILVANGLSRRSASERGNVAIMVTHVIGSIALCVITLATAIPFFTQAAQPHP